MNKYKIFLDYLNEIYEASLANRNDMPAEVAEVIEELEIKSETIENKPEFTDIGLQILEYMQICGKENLTARNIADGIESSSRVVNGAIRKLTNGNYVSKVGSNPVIYNITDKGKNIDINKQKVKENN